MSQVVKQQIMVGSGRIVGQMSVDGGMVRGEGGPIRPELVIPLTIKMQNRPADSTLALTALRAWLSPNQQAFRQSALSAPIFEPILGGFPARSYPQGDFEHIVWLRFALNAAEIESIEALRQRAGPDAFTLYLGIEATVAGLRSYDRVGPDTPVTSTQHDTMLGMFSEVLPFWTTRIDSIWVQIEESRWIRDVLPGLGYDRLRLVEMVFPPPLPGHASAAGQFDNASRALDEGRYGDSISACRGLLNMWESQLKATKDNRVAAVVADRRGWAEDDIRRLLLDVLWKQVGDLANAAHHPEGNVDSELFDASDARLILLLTAALSEYIQSD